MVNCRASINYNNNCDGWHTDTHPHPHTHTINIAMWWLRKENNNQTNKYVR